MLKVFFSSWTQVAGVLLMSGALAWALKLTVIISTNGRIIDTGAAALFMKIGLLTLVVGSTGIGNYLSNNKAILWRALAILLSPVVVFGSFLLIGTLLAPLFQHTGIWYAPQEAPIAAIVLIYAVIGYLLFRTTPRMAN